MAGAEQTVSILAILKDQLSQPLSQGAKAAKEFKEGTDSADKSAAQLTAKSARLAQRLFSLQFAVQGLTSGVSGFPALNEKVQALTGGLSTFAGIVSLFPNKAGLIIGAVAGIGQAIGGLVAPSKEAREEIERTQKKLLEFERIEKEFNERAIESGKARERQALVDLALADSPEARKLALQKTRLERDRRDLENEAGRILELEQARLPSGLTKKRYEEISQAIERAETEVRRLAESVKKLNTEVEAGQAIENFIKGMKGLGAEGAELQQAVDQGLVTGLKRVNEELRLAEERLKLFKQLPDLARERLSATGQVLQESIEQLQLEKKILEHKKEQTEEEKKHAEAAAKVIVHLQTTEELAVDIGVALADTTVAFVDGLIEGNASLKQFAADFLKAIGLMILRALLLRAIMAGLGAVGVGVTATARTGGLITRGGIRRFDVGGPVPGPSVDRDIVPALLTPGEFVVNRDAVDHYGVQGMAALNRMMVPREALSGFSVGAAALNLSGSYGDGGEVVSPVGGQTAPVAFVVADEQQFERLLHGGEPAMLRFIERHRETISGMLAKRRGV